MTSKSLTLFGVFMACGFSLSSNSAEAKLQLPVVYNYSQASAQTREDSRLWSQLSEDEVPWKLLASLEIENPTRSFDRSHPSVFFNDDDLIVCYKSCSGPQPVEIRSEGESHRVVTRFDGSEAEVKASFVALKISNVYYWSRRMIASMKKLGLKPSKKLTVYVDRDVTNPETGSQIENNAFFYSNDWSLSFLRVKNTLVLKKLFKTKFTNPSFDPSVILHETMHSVFESQIGPILNREVYGLHEAFADYFALAELNSAQLGLIFTSGRPLRNTEPIHKYKSGMESHDLGLVVAAALNKIRRSLPETKRTTSDRLILSVLKTYSENPFLLAGSLSRIFMERALSPEFGFSKTEIENFQNIWNDTEMLEPVVRLTEVPQGTPVKTPGYFSVSIRVKNPDNIAQAWGLPKESTSEVGYFYESPGPAGTESVWRFLGVKTGSRNDSIWILYSKKFNAILKAFDVSGKEILNSRDPQFSPLLNIKSGMSEIEKWQKHEMDIYADLIQSKGLSSWIYQLKNAQRTNIELQINGRKVMGQLYQAQIEPTPLAATLAWISKNIAPGLLEVVNSVHRIAFFTVNSQDFPNLKTTPLFENQKLMGVQSLSKTGIEQTVLLTSFDLDSPVLARQP